MAALVLVKDVDGNVAIFFSTYDDVLKLRQPATEGELYLLRFLEYLDDSFEVFFNPYMNGDRPDIVIMRKGYGVLIIEVKDYNLDLYELDEHKNWRLQKDKYIVKSPIEQVKRYKNNLFELHIEDFLEMKIMNSKYYSVVACAVYLHNASQAEIKKFCNEYYSENELKYFDFIGRDNLKEEDFNSLLKERYLDSDSRSSLFTDELYEKFKRFLNPPMHMKEGKPLNYTSEQQNLIKGLSKKQLQIKGVAGSGKTAVLAAMAVEAYNRAISRGSGENILILTYNTTLRNYIRDKISQVKKDFPWSAFYITHYHEFIKDELNNVDVVEYPPEKWEDLDVKEILPSIPLLPPENLTPKGKDEYWEKNYSSNKKLFNALQSRIKRYDAILIDEVQDYKRDWLDIVKDSFLDKDGEYFLFHDIKQNIYKYCDTQDKNIVVNVVGLPYKLKTCHRSDTKIQKLLLGYQKNVFKNKYEQDEFANAIDYSDVKEITGSVNYKYFPNEGNSVVLLYDLIREYITDKQVHPNDITVLGGAIEWLKQFELYYRCLSNEKVHTMFETLEMTNKIIFNEVNRLKKNMKEQGDKFTFKDALKAHPACDHEKFERFFGQGGDWVDELKKLFSGKKGDEVNRILAKLFALHYLYKLYPDKLREKLRTYCLSKNISLDEFLSFVNRYPKKIDEFEEGFGDLRDYEEIRQNKKYNFYMNSGLIKISTIHSFKGWECEWVFLVIDNQSTFGDELVYTGISRARSNLVIVNFGNSEYDAKLKNIIEKIN